MLKAVRISDKGKVVGVAVQVNPIGVEPDALHQAPGLAVGTDHQLFMTWSSARQGGARSTDRGVTFEPPVLVNDDDLPINHSSESLLADQQGHVYLAWLDSRDKDKS